MAPKEPKEEKKEAPLTMKGLNDRINQLAGGIDSILEHLENNKKQPELLVARTDGTIKPLEEKMESTKDGSYLSNDMLPPQYQQLFEKYFDPNDGFTARLSFPEINEKGVETGGLLFTIYVPEKFSNATNAHKALYKQDLRTRALQPASMAKGIEDWCAIVARNLKYNKNVKLK